jgi:DNA-directed RNA polymerase specialized sigma24 family protein
MNKPFRALNLSEGQMTAGVGAQSVAAEAAFVEFFEATHGDVFRAVLVVARDWHVAEDATATAYMRAWERWPVVAHHPSPVAWVIRVAMNDSVSWWRRARRLVGTFGVASATGAPDFPDPDVRAAVDALPLRQRQVVALRVVLGFDAKDTAALLGIAPGTVGAHLSRALDACRARLEADDGAARLAGGNDG